MSYLTAAVVLVGLLGVVNLLLSFGVLRRLRRHSELLSARQTEQGPLMLAAGQTVPAVTATAIDGRPVAPAEFPGQTLVGFFSPGCTACHERLPSFLSYAGELADPAKVLAVIVGTGADVAALESELAAVARVVREPADGTLTAAFAVRGFPSFLLVEPGGMVLASGLAMSELPVHATA
ncbi:TlpA family protein disulfide reductase [Actinoplanes derwentensis]|uniref:AhpC/TSA family protein n=1 Tax=Actinoplanes derwentensis TaxID=113562 RepID=A0A1H1VT66_9ACTN|nr:redoxin domain-containing protein [Actinoplanes derwentensis]GID83586.1 hypothetical protein Ade03nite_25100 [Actinoplanes derwentensis]SDS88134.1 AhpC/TSA family protein [Actinoplanes derwentensis]